MSFAVAFRRSRSPNAELRTGLSFTPSSWPAIGSQANWDRDVYGVLGKADGRFVILRRGNLSSSEEGKKQMRHLKMRRFVILRRGNLLKRFENRTVGTVTTCQ